MKPVMVKELIKELEKYDPTMPVVISIVGNRTLYSPNTILIHNRPNYDKVLNICGGMI